MDPGTIVVYDRGYNDYSLFGQWTSRGVYFVTRMKDKTLHEVVERRTVPQDTPISKDQIIRLTGSQAEEKCPFLLRRVEVYIPEKNATYAFLTNHLMSGSTTIAAIYKDRWLIRCRSLMHNNKSN